MEYGISDIYSKIDQIRVFPDSALLPEVKKVLLAVEAQNSREEFFLKNNVHKKKEHLVF